LFIYQSGEKTKPSVFSTLGVSRTRHKYKLVLGHDIDKMLKNI